MSADDSGNGGGAAAVSPPAPPAAGVSALPLNLEEKANAFQRERHHRAHMHMHNLGDVKKSSDDLRLYKPSILAPFFGANTTEDVFEMEKKMHPCQMFSIAVHQCLEANSNDYSSCQSRIYMFQHCLNEFRI